MLCTIVQDDLAKQIVLTLAAFERREVPQSIKQLRIHSVMIQLRLCNKRSSSVPPLGHPHYSCCILVAHSTLPSHLSAPARKRQKVDVDQQLRTVSFFDYRKNVCQSCSMLSMLSTCVRLSRAELLLVVHENFRPAEFR
jgi:hypothetical protein